MSNYTPPLNLPTRKGKGLTKMFSGVSNGGKVGEYVPDCVLVEGQPVKWGDAAGTITASTTSDGATTIGLALQDTYDESTFNPQLAGYHFANDTSQRLDGQPIGVLMGSGWAQTKNYTGDVAWGDTAYIGANGVLTATADVDETGDDELPIIFETSGSDGATPVTIRFAFPFPGPAAR